MSKALKSKTKERKLKACLNCQQDLDQDNYCPSCGQQNSDKNISFKTLIQDFLGDYFSFDSKFFRTLIPLFARPGQVAKEFMDGHRVKHIPPLRMLIFSSFIFFFIWGLTFDLGREGQESVADSVQKERAEALARGDSSMVMDGGLINFNIDGIGSTSNSSIDVKLNEITRMAREGMAISEAADSVAKDNNEFEKKLYVQMAKIWLQDKSTLARYFVGNLSIAILVAQPFCAFLLYLIYLRRRKKFRFIGHLVFSIYLHGWLMILATIAILLTKVFPSIPIRTVLTLPSLVYLFFALKAYYQQGWKKSLAKTALFSLLYVGLIMPTFLILSFGASFYFF